MFFPLSFRLCRRLALCLALTALLATLAAPLQAAPLDRAAPLSPIAGLIDWIQGLLMDLGTEADSGDEPGDKLDSVILRGSTCIDPDGVAVPCPATVTIRVPNQPAPEATKLRGKPRMR